MLEKLNFSEFLNILPGSVYLKNKNGVYLDCNVAATKMLGLTKSEIIGKTDYDFIKICGSKEIIDAFVKTDQEVIRTGIPQLNIEEPPFYVADGKIIYQLTNKVPLKDEEGNIIGVIGVSIDITKQKKMQEQLEKDKKQSLEFLSKLSKEIMGNSGLNYQTIEEYVRAIRHHLESIIACMPGNVYWTDRNSVYLGGNDNTAKWMGLSSHAQIAGITYENMAKLGRLDKGQEKAFKRDDEEVMRTGIPKLNVEEPPVTDHDGNIIQFLTSRVPLRDENNQITGIIGISIDITKRKEMETALLKSKEIAETANHTKTLFMENMSHDFKTPLNGIYGVVQLLKDREDLPEDVKELVDAQYKSIVRLNKLVQSILDFDRISGGKINLQEEELNLLDILESIIHNLSYQLKGKNINLTIHYSPSVPHQLISDSYAVTSILLNLLSNAVKFTEKGEVSVAVNCLSLEKQEALLQIKITDTGQGIPADKLEQIFERFYRLEPSSKGLKEGHGIGLSVVKELIGKLNGKIEVESQFGKGSTFTVTLPFKIQDTALLILGWQKHYPDVRILLVNDNKNSSEVILERLGKKVATSVDSKNIINALQAAASENKPYHILIIDDEIQTIDPIELMKIIPYIKGIPACMPLLASQPKNKVFFDAARAAGYVDFIIKPVLPSELETTITQAWEQWNK